jgi:hypothetical protein
MIVQLDDQRLSREPLEASKSYCFGSHHDGSLKCPDTEQLLYGQVGHKPPAYSTPAQCFTFGGFEKNKATREFFYLAENYEQLFKGRINIRSLARNWIENAGHSSHNEQIIGEELKRTNPNGKFQGVHLHYIVEEEKIPGSNGWFISQEKGNANVNSVVKAIEEWLSSRPVPEGRIRLFFGTSTHNMNNILEHKMVTRHFKEKNDFENCLPICPSDSS